MPAVRTFQILGLKMWFWSDDHEPPHFHAKRQGEWEVKVHFMLAPADMIELVWGDAPPGSALKELRQLAEAHRLELIVEWEEIHGN